MVISVQHPTLVEKLSDEEQLEYAGMRHVFMEELFKRRRILEDWAALSDEMIRPQGLELALLQRRYQENGICLQRLSRDLSAFLQQAGMTPPVTLGPFPA